MRILITGGAGFIGSAVIRYIMMETKHEVINVDKLTYAGNLESLALFSSDERYHFEKVDICDSAEIERVIQQYQPDKVMHLAAESHVDRSITGPAEFIQTNIVGTYVLLEAVRKYWERLDSGKKNMFIFHHISTDEVYGDLPHPDEHHSKKELPLFTENTPYSPSSPYSASKAASDHLVRAWNKTYKVPTIVTNCSNNYGPFHYPEKLIPLIISNALKGKSIPVYGDGSQIRDWLFVEDHACALVLVLTEGVVGETYNIGGHNEKRNIEVVEAICSLLEELVPGNDNALANKQGGFRSLIKNVQDRLGHDIRYAIDAKKIETELGWTPSESFDSGLRKTVSWYIENQDWCEKVLNTK